jgi:hypothetical protein
VTTERHQDPARMHVVVAPFVRGYRWRLMRAGVEILVDLAPSLEHAINAGKAALQTLQEEETL